MIGGTIIREVVDNGPLVRDFFSESIHPDRLGPFLNRAEYLSQWTTAFVEFIDDLDSQGLVTQEWVAQNVVEPLY